MNQNLIYGILGFLILASAASAYYPGETTPISALYIVDGVPTNAYANITIYDPDNITVTGNQPMIVYQPGLFYYNYTFGNKLGDYTALVIFYNSTWDTQGSASATLRLDYNYLADINNTLNPNLPPAYDANDTIWTFHCPVFARVNETFTIWADYKHALNASDILGANIIFHNTTTSYNLTYNSITGRYEIQFSSASNMTWIMNLTAAKSPLDPQSHICTTIIGPDFGLTIRLWEQVELQNLSANKNYIITDKNYNKQLIDPYINDFAWIIAKNNDHNASGVYNYCNIPIGGVQSFLDPLAGLLGNNLTNLLTNDLKNVAGCEDYWFRAEYRNGSATIPLPWKGNYSLYLLDGVATWENDYSPPNIVKSDLWIPLGEIEIPERRDLTLDYWMPHSELDFWASVTDSTFIFFISLLPLILFFGLLFIGFPIQVAGLILILLESSWLITGVLHLL
jgi:hypothetical protein